MAFVFLRASRVQVDPSPPAVVKVRRYHQRGSTLLAEAATVIAQNIWIYSVTELTALPSDLAQQVLDQLTVLGKLSKSSLALFASQHLYYLRLEDYPGVGNDWLRLLSRSPLQIVNLSRCQQVCILSKFVGREDRYLAKLPDH